MIKNPVEKENADRDPMDLRDSNRLYEKVDIENNIINKTFLTTQFRLENTLRTIERNSATNTKQSQNSALFPKRSKSKINDLLYSTLLYSTLTVFTEYIYYISKHILQHTCVLKRC